LKNEFLGIASFLSEKLKVKNFGTLRGILFLITDDADFYNKMNA
jgi:hypothetical protein